MARAAWGVLLLLLSLSFVGCTFTFGGGAEHRPEIERLLQEGSGNGTTAPSWGMGITGTRPSPLPTAQDDAAFWRGVATRPVADNGFDGDAIADAVRRGSLADVKKAVASGITPGAGAPMVEQGGREPTEPSPAAVDRAIEAWEAWKVERGIAPVDLGRARPEREKTGP